MRKCPECFHYGGEECAHSRGAACVEWRHKGRLFRFIKQCRMARRHKLIEMFAALT